MLVTRPLLSPEWVARLKQFKKLIVGFSGGLDSTVLLHVLASTPPLSNQLLAVHINHGISGNSLNWQRHCEQLCLDLGIAFIAKAIEFDRSANVEEAARNARYDFFSSLLEDNDCLVLGHHLDDQAETVLLQLFRGAGVDGLAAMQECSNLGAGQLARPFLTCPRVELEHYARIHELKWIEDESNQDTKYSRNYLRHRVMPLLLEKWPGVAGNISRAATHCQQAKANLEVLAIKDCPGLLNATDHLLIEPIKGLEFERITNVLKFWLKKNRIQLPSSKTFHRIIHEIIFAKLDAMPTVSWNQIQVRRFQQHLYLLKADQINLPKAIKWQQFPASLTYPDADIKLSAVKAQKGLMIPKDAQIEIRFRKGGEEIYWHGQTKHLKKLFQEWQIPPWVRDRVPLVYINDQLACVVGYAVSDVFFTTNPLEAWSIVNNS
ncbi:TPA: tRNA lysidine(34) synthetase TilS [Legionella pneumophila subsp. pneumophila]|nr:tRNA lysidine(34) synthetase TilS [Legionella pneumophila subsp. pneumophila]